MLSRDDWKVIGNCAAAAKRLCKVRQSHFDITNDSDADQFRAIVDRAIGDVGSRVQDIILNALKPVHQEE